MYVTFHQNRISRSVKTIHTNLFAKNGKLHKIATTNSTFEEIDNSDIRHRITYMCINFQQNQVSIIDQSKPCTQVYLQKNCNLHKFATTNNNLENLILSDTHRHIPYRYINFQQNRVSRSVKTVHTNIFAKNHKLHKFATCNSNFKTKHYLHMHNPNVDI